VSLGRRLAAEAVGTAMLLAAVVGSGIMGDRLAGGNVAVALLANAIATGAALVVLILVLGPVSGAHFNPAVSLFAAARGKLRWSEVPGYALAQLGGALAGVVLAHAMFDEPLLSVSTHVRSGVGQLIGELVATVGLLATIEGVSRRRPDAVPAAVGLYITSAYWFTSSTSFANPAVTLARAFTRTFAGIRPADVAGFVAAQLLGTAAVLLESVEKPAPATSPEGCSDSSGTGSPGHTSP